MLPQRRSDITLWSTIRRRAIGIVLDCVVIGAGEGGFVLVGVGKGIKISMYYRIVGGQDS